MDASVFPPFIPGAPPVRPPAEPAPEAAATEPADDASHAEHTDFDYGVEEGASAGFSATLPEEAPDAGPEIGDAAEDLPWLELGPGARTLEADEEPGRYELEPFRGEPLEAEPFDLTAMDAQGGGEPSGAQHGTPAEDGAFPDWLAWDAQDATEAEAEIADAAPEPWAEDVIPGDDFMQMEAAAQDSAADAAPWTEDLPVGDGSLEVDLPGAGDAVEERPSAAAGDAPAAAPAGPVAMDAAGAEALAEVAGRLERIARTLRDDPGDLLAGASADPLDLLVAGYALGLAHGRAQGRSG